MAHIRKLEPHDPLPPDTSHHVLVLRRFDERQPDRVVIDVTLVDKRGQRDTRRPARPDGRLMTLDEATDAATRVADSEGLRVVFVVDRTEGPREKQVLQRGGDHSIGGARLVDS